MALMIENISGARLPLDDIGIALPISGTIDLTIESDPYDVANATINDTTIDLDFTTGQRIRIQAQDAGSGTIRDTVANVFVRWRA